METLRLNERRIDALKPRKSACDARDRELKGFGVRVLASGAKRYFVHTQHLGRRIWKIVGQAGSIDVDKARAQARVMLASTRKRPGEDAAALPHLESAFAVSPASGRGPRRWLQDPVPQATG